VNRGALLVLVLVALLLLGGPAAVVDRVVNGGRVGPKTTVQPDGLIADDPYLLALEAGYDLEVYALMRCLASEHGNDPEIYLRCVAWAVRNKAAEDQRSIFALLTDGKGAGGDFFFGEQKAAAGTKYASTRADPLERHAMVAQEVVAAPDYLDPTGGATHFFSPKAQDALAAKAAAGDERYQKYLGKDAAFIFASWTARGLYSSGAEPVIPEGIDGQRLTLFRRLA
jgi:hypothetical protein